MTESCPGVIAVVPAAGNGSRMLTSLPKQYLTIGQYTILEHSIFRLLAHSAITEIVVVLSADDDHFKKLAIASDPRISCVIGGNQRADSVLAGLLAIDASKTSWILVHDAARPCLHYDDLNRLLALTRYSAVGGILAAPVRDTMKRSAESSHSIVHTVERERLWHALTPQLFPLTLLRHCLHQALDEGVVITDEASALEYCGYSPELVRGRSDNIKVTCPEDLALATFYLSRAFDKERV